MQGYYPRRYDFQKFHVNVHVATADIKLRMENCMTPRSLNEDIIHDFHLGCGLCMCQQGKNKIKDEKFSKEQI